jgi:hypothetical protein
VCYPERYWKGEDLLHGTTQIVDKTAEISSEGSRLLELARMRRAREVQLSDSIHTPHYAAASLGQSPYVALPNVGIIVLRRKGWGC